MNNPLCHSTACTVPVRLAARPGSVTGRSRRRTRGSDRAVAFALGQVSSGRPPVLLLVWLLVATAGCAADALRGPGAWEDLATGPSDIDPARAHLPLAQLEPVPVRPTRPESLEPLSERASGQLAKARRLVGEQRYTEAAIELERALRYDPNHPRIHRALAVLHWQAGNVERAKTHADKALALNPDDATAHYIVGQWHGAGRDDKSAITAYRTALLCTDIDREPQVDALCRYQLAEALAREGYLEASLEQYEAFEQRKAALTDDTGSAERIALEYPLPEAAAHAKSRILEKLGRYREAASELAPLAAQSADDVSLALRYARLLMLAAQIDEALSVTRSISSDEDEVLDLLAEIHGRAGHPEQFVDDLRERMGRRPGEPRLVHHLADRLVESGRVDEAKQELRRYLEGRPEAFGTRVLLIDICIQDAAWREVLRLSATGIERNPERTASLAAKIEGLARNEAACRGLLKPPAAEESPAALYLQGILASSAGRTEEALHLLRLSSPADAAFDPARVALARLYHRLYRYDEALEVAGRAQEDVPESAALEVVLGEVYERLDDLQSAELHFKAALQLDRLNTASTLALAKLYRRTNRSLQVQQQLRVLLEREPDCDEARELLALVYYESGKRDVAFEEFERLKDRAHSPLVRARAAAQLDLDRTRDLSAYREALLSAMNEHGPDAKTWIAVAGSFEPHREPERILEALGSALAIDRENEEAAFRLAQTLEVLLDFEGAARQFEALLRRRPNRHTWRFGASTRRRGLVELLWINRDFDGALNVVREAEARDDLDERWQNHYRLADVETLRRANRSNELLARLQKWAEAEPDEAVWKIALAEMYTREDQASRAVPILRDLYRSNPADAEHRDRLVGALVAAGKGGRAAQHLLEWLNEDPENDSLISKLADVLASSGRLDDALELTHNRLLHTYDRVRFQNFWLSRLRRAERYETCLELLEELIDEVVQLLHDPQGHLAGEQVPDEQRVRLPNEPWSPSDLVQRLSLLRRLLAETLILSNAHRDAEGRLSSWLESTPDQAERFIFLRLLALSYQSRGDSASAENAMERALRLRPNDPGFNNDLAYGWIERGIRLGEAEPMIRFAVWQDPFNGAYLDTYGWLQYKKGAFGEAEQWLTRASAVRGGNDPVVLDHLGDACWRAGNVEEAVKNWTAAVAALTQPPEDQPVSEDERRVRTNTRQKIEDARAGRPAAVAPLAAEPTEKDDRDAEDTLGNAGPG